MHVSLKCPACGVESAVACAGGHCSGCLLQLGLAADTGDAGCPAPGDCIGRYRLIEEIGEGGCGVVFLAEQSEPVRRRVALKIIKPGRDNGQVVARFEAERQVLALLDHPHIAKVFDAGATETGQPFFVMELVRGTPITDYCDRQKLSPLRRLELFAEVCQAIQHAHQKGIIHRDLKPSNILVADGENGLPGTPRIIDFGIAKSTELVPGGAVSNRSQQLIGTPAYMSPEQAGCGEAGIDTRSDIYSLGVLLYELLTGLTPFDAAELRHCPWDEMPRFIRETAPLKPSARLVQSLFESSPEAGRKWFGVPPSGGKARANAMALKILNPPSHAAASPPEGGTPNANFRTDFLKPVAQTQNLIHLLRGDLDAIIMKCLEKDRARRYETAHALRLDLQHYLRHEPVAARPPTRAYRFQKFVRRNQLAFATAVIVLLALLSALGIATWSFLRERDARRRAVLAETAERQFRQQAEAARQRALVEAARSREVASFLTDVLKGAGPSAARGRDNTMLREILDRTTARISRDLKDQPEVEAGLRNTLAEVCHELGLYQQMEEMAREALRLSRSRPEKENPVAAKALELHGQALLRLGRLDEAEAAARESLAMRKKLMGGQSAEAGDSLNNLGLVLRARGRFAEAESLFRESLAIDAKLPGAENAASATKLANLGAVLWSEGKFADAESAYRSVLARRRKLYGNEHLEVATALNNLATVLLSERQLDEAESLAREALAMDRKFLGSAHPDLAISLGNLSNILAAEGKVVEADVTQREADSIRKDHAPGLSN